jgi:type VI secretion system secreted protein VgrG
MLKQKITFGIDKKEIPHFTSIELNQTINNHHHFKISLPHSVIEKPRAYTIENAQNWLGKVVHIVLENKNNFLGIITNIQFAQEEDHVGNQIILSGFSKTILLESGKKMHSWEDTTLQEMVQEIIKTATGKLLQNDIQPENVARIEYQTQHLETDFQYIQRLAKQYNEWLLYDGEKLFFGKPTKQEEAINLTYSKDIYNLNISVQVIPNQFSAFTYNENTNNLYQAQTQNKIEGLPKLGNEAFEASEKLYSTPSFEYGRIATGYDMALETILKKRQESIMADANYITASSHNNQLKIGSIIRIDALVKNQIAHLGTLKDELESQEVGQYIITEITHKATDIGEYSNHFKALPAFIKKLPEPQIDFPQAQIQQAIVVDNADPNGNGRIRVQLLWQQTKNLCTPWLRVMTPDAGTSTEVSTNRGMVFIPEVGDHVLLGFRYNDPNRPFVMGSLFNGTTAKGGGANNDFRTITNRSGHYLEFEEIKNITLADKKGNKFHIDSTGSNINVTALETFTVNCKNMIFNVEENMTVNVDKDQKTIIKQNSIINIGNDLKTIAKNNILQDSGKNNIFSSGDNTEISASKELELYAKKKIIGFSDGKTEFGAKHQMHVYGASSLITALDKIEYKAPQMNKLPESGKFKYDKEKRIIDVKWKCGNVNQTIKKASIGDKASLLVQTRNYEEGDTVSIIVDEVDGNDLKDGVKEVTYTGTVNKEGFAILKEELEIEKVKEKLNIVNGRIEVFGHTMEGKSMSCWVDCDENGNRIVKEKKSMWKSLFE